MLIEERLPSGKVCWYAEDPDLPGCCATGASPSGAARNLVKSRRAWLAVARKLGQSVPDADMSNVFTDITFADRGWPRTEGTACMGGAA